MVAGMKGYTALIVDIIGFSPLKGKTPKGRPNLNEDAEGVSFKKRRKSISADQRVNLGVQSGHNKVIL